MNNSQWNELSAEQRKMYLLLQSGENFKAFQHYKMSHQGRRESFKNRKGNRK